LFIILWKEKSHSFHYSTYDTKEIDFFYLHHFLWDYKTNDPYLNVHCHMIRKTFLLVFFPFYLYVKIIQLKVVYHIPYVLSFFVISSAFTYPKKKKRKLKPDWPLYYYKLKWMLASFFFLFEIRNDKIRKKRIYVRPTHFIVIA